MYRTFFRKIALPIFASMAVMIIFIAILGQIVLYITNSNLMSILVMLSMSITYNPITILDIKVVNNDDT